MRKIIIIFILTFMIIYPNVIVQAGSNKFYDEEYLEDVYIEKIEKGTSNSIYEQMIMLKRTSDNRPIYRIGLYESISNDFNKPIYLSNYNSYSEEIKKKIELIAYYGYGYQNHTEKKWYIVTQFLIWKEVDNNSDIYFTDSLNGNRINKYINEISEINNLINNHYIELSFNGNIYDIGIKEELIITDENKVLSKYRPIYNSLGSVERDGNRLKIKAGFVGSTSIILRNGYTNRNPQVYISNIGADLLIREDYTPIDNTIHINVTAGKINLTTIDNETGNTYSQGETTLEGTTYNLYDNNGNLVEVLRINKNGQASSNDLPYGVYYLEEITPGIGYKLDKKTYKIELTKDKKIKDLKLEKQVIRAKITINNLIKILNTNDLEAHVESIFSFYNSKNELVGNVTIDKNGYGDIILPYGKYLVKQEKIKDGCISIEEFYIEIIDEKTIELNLINKQKGYNLEITKIDKESKLPIRFSKSKYKIKDLIINKYLNYNGIEVFETDETGKLILPFKIGVGKYQLEEISTSIGYKRIGKNYFFNVNPNSSEVISLIIENEKLYGSLEILNQGEKITINDNQLSYDRKDLKGIEFSLYAEEDIISGDGKIHFKKNKLVSKKITNEQGKIVFDNLIFGKYYVIKTTNLDEYIVDNKKYYVEIENENINNSIEIFNTLKKGIVKIVTQDNENLQEIENTEFEIYNNKFEKIYEVNTDIDGNAYVFDLPLGKYYLKEKKIPFPYILNSKIVEVNLDQNQQEIQVTFKNNKQELEIEVPHTNIEINESNINYNLFLILISIYIISNMITKQQKHD